MVDGHETVQKRAAEGGRVGGMPVATAREGVRMVVIR